MNAYENKSAASWTLADECAGLADEPGADIESCPTTADEAIEYQVALFAWWCMACGGRKQFVEDKELKYAICEESWFNAQTASEQKRLKEYERYCVIVPDHFFDWTNIKKYKDNLTPHAEMWLDEYGSTYVVDAVHGMGHMLHRVGEDTKLGTTADYWFADKDDVQLAAAIDKFAALIGQAMDALPFEKVEKDEDTSKKDKAAEGEANTPGTPKYITKERNKTMGIYHDVLEKRYNAYAGYSRDKIIQRIKKSKQSETVRMNELSATGSLIPCMNGVYDLRKGAFRSAVAGDYISAYAPTWYVPDAKDDAVTKFLKEFTCDRTDLQEFLAQVFGVALDMNMITRTMCQLWGEKTTNGKSTLVKALVATLGNSEQHGLAVQLPYTVISMGKNANDDSKVTPSLAMVKDSKVMFASEPPKGMRVNWAQVKRLTGGDVIPVNQKYERQYNLVARATLFIDTNHTLRVDDGTVFDRGTMQIVPCDDEVTEDRKDKDLDAKLSTESAKSAWMAWMIAGYKLYIKNGKQFSNPECVKKALEDNKRESDRIGRFISENYIMTTDNSKKVTMKDLWNQYCEWSKGNGYDHYETYPNFSKYFENKPRAYLIGKRDNQKAVCGLVAASEFTSPIVRIPVIDGDPIDWYIQNHMMKNSDKDADEEIQLTKIYADYVRKVEAAGGATLDIWPLYGVLLSKGWTAEMGAPGVVSEVKVKGWHLKTDEERELERIEQLRMKRDSLWADVSKAMEALPDETKKALDVVCNDPGLRKWLDTTGNSIRQVIVSKMLSGKTWDAVLDEAIGAASN